MGRDNNQQGENTEESIDDMFQHLDGAKERYKADKKRTRKKKSSGRTPLQQAMQSRSDGAVLASNYAVRLKEIEDNDAVTHRSGKAWTTAKIGVDTHDRLPIYYRQDGLVTHKGYITDILIHPDENTAAAKRFIDNITDSDTYDEFHEQLDTTTYIVSDGERLSEPFSQTELELLSGNGYVSENFSRQPAYVIQREGDFPELA